jgi:hypothetical protein
VAIYSKDKEGPKPVISKQIIEDKEKKTRDDNIIDWIVPVGRLWLNVMVKERERSGIRSRSSAS